VLKARKKRALTWEYEVEQVTGWARDLIVEVAGCGVVSHTGSVA
jgi:hypothetical protein